jgi:hypothetical protein
MFHMEVSTQIIKIVSMDRSRGVAVDLHGSKKPSLTIETESHLCYSDSGGRRLGRLGIPGVMEKTVLHGGSVIDGQAGTRNESYRSS